MKNKLITVQKALCMIEVKGSNTLLMADSLRLLEQCIQECPAKRGFEAQNESEKTTESVEG